MIQWRVSRRAGTCPSLRIVMVHENTNLLSRGSDCSSIYEVSTSTRIRGFAGSGVMPCMVLRQPYREHVAMCRVQDRVFGKIHKDGQAVALAAAEHDQIGGFFLRNPENFRLGVAGFDPDHRVGQAGSRDQ